jgi:hypothetical protein
MFSVIMLDVSLWQWPLLQTHLFVELESNPKLVLASVDA